MRHALTITTVGITALVLATGSAVAQTSVDKPAVERARETVAGAARDMKAEISDSWITSKTKIALFADDRVKGGQVHVETRDGIAMLRGKVDSAEAKSRAALVTQAIDGVRDVKNELQVVPPSQRSRVAADDEIIAKNVESRLARDPQLKGAEVHVDDGVVALTGDVKTIEASARASELARGVAGVRYVKNDLAFGSPSRSQ